VPVALALLAAAGWLIESIRVPAPLKLLAAMPGAVMLGFHAGLPSRRWIQIVVVLLTVVGGWGMADFDQRWADRGYVPVLWAVTVVGVYYTVPDTTEALVLLGAALPIALVGWPRALASFGLAGSWAAAGLLAWTIGIEGHFRESAIVGGVACLGLLALEPLISLLRRDRWTPLQLLSPSWWGVIMLAAADLALVYVASRVAGLRGHRAHNGLLVGGLIPAIAIEGLEVAGVAVLGLLMGLHRGALARRRSPS
jgi:hypothetical protein